MEEDALEAILKQLRHEDLSNKQVGRVLGVILFRLNQRGPTPLEELLRELADRVERERTTW